MPDSPTSEPESDFVCDCEESMRSACIREPFYGQHEGKAYCVLHIPFSGKTATAAQTIVLLETVLGPVQAALLALAIRRKFMR